MNNVLAKRIRKLESILQARALPPAVFRHGSVQRLPNDTSGERHVAVSRNELTALANVERCEFEERDGPALGDWIAYPSAEGLSMVSPDGNTVRKLTARKLLAYDFSKDGAQVYGIVQNTTGEGA